MMLRVALFALLVVVLAVSAEESLQARYSGGRSRNNNRSGRSSNNNSSNNKSNSNNRGGNSNNNDSSNNNNHGNNRARLDELAGNGLRDKVINRGTHYLGTKYSHSGSTKVVRSRKDNWYHKNFVNTVTSNLATLRKEVHTDTKVLVKKPLTVDNLKVNQHTNYVKNIWPKLEKVWVSQFKEVVAPSHAETVSKTASASSKTVRHPLQVNHISRHRNLGTRYERTQELGVIGGNRGGSSNNNSGNRRGGNNSSNNNNKNSSNNNRRNNRNSSNNKNNSSNNKNSSNNNNAYA